MLDIKLFFFLHVKHIMPLCLSDIHVYLHVELESKV